tara:strand:+ start:703 stop:984 length:282 start_codon:yes stop_codon:yes gene_type:complete
MARPPNLIPSQYLNVALPEPLFARLSLHLYSELEGRVPLGSYSRFLQSLLRDYFDGRRLDLAPYLGSAPNALTISGTPEAIAAIQAHLEKEPK